MMVRRRDDTWAKQVAGGRAGLAHAGTKSAGVCGNEVCRWRRRTDRRGRNRRLDTRTAPGAHWCFGAGYVVGLTVFGVKKHWYPDCGGAGRKARQWLGRTNVSDNMACRSVQPDSPGCWSSESARRGAKADQRAGHQQSESHGCHHGEATTRGRPFKESPVYDRGLTKHSLLHSLGCWWPPPVPCPH
jgi:hypothetical protein